MLSLNSAARESDAEEATRAKIRIDELIVKSGALQQAILNSANFSVIATDEKGTIQLFNAGAELMLGYATSDVVDRSTPADISDQRELSVRAEALSQENGVLITPGFEALVYKAARGIEDIYELTYIRKDGSRLPAVVSVTALRTDNGPIIGYLLIATSNIVRKDAEDNRSWAEESFQLMIASVTDCAIIMLDEHGRVKTWNTGAHRIKGYDAKDIIGQPISIFYSPEDIAAREPERALREAAQTGRFEDDGWRIRKDGTRFWANVVITAIRDSGGVLLGYAQLARDMTARKNADDAVKESEASLRSILDTVPDAIVIVDEDGRIESFSLAASRLFGYSVEQANGQNVKILMPEAYWGQHGDYLARFREIGERRGDGTGRVVDGLRRDGSTFPMELAVGEAMGGNRRLFTGFVRDITERQRFEAELSAAKAIAEAANLAKSEFLSSMSHELRTPLNAILGFAQLMATDIPPPTTNQKASIDQILQAGWYLLELINEVLDLALIESGRLSLSMEPVSLPELLSECDSMMEPLAEKRGIMMTFPDFEAPCVVLADRTRMRQVIINLLSNAIKYNRPGGSVLVEYATRDDGRIRLSVRDSGLGLSPEKQAQLFQPFNRLGQEGGVEQGTGIGLVVTRRLVETMQGAIGVESSVNVGTLFWVDLRSANGPLPDHSETIPTTSELSRDGRAAPRKTVLYVEDNPANLKLVEMLIARRPELVLLTAGDGDLGIELAQLHLPDVILMDINLPGISGTKALALLRAAPVTAHIPIVALSANARPRDIEAGLSAGFFRYLTKPIKVDELLDTLDIALGADVDSVPAAPVKLRLV
jgi:PAS domain S-box-containing protein